MRLSSRQIGRAVGALVGQAASDALGVPYEFGTLVLDGEPDMRGGGLGGIAPGQWSDDTEMAVCIAEVTRPGPTCATRPLSTWWRRGQGLRGDEIQLIELYSDVQEQPST